jgi:exopolysaccharide biosynthesis polyprenyl glycosylphosphotransferase
MAFMKIMPVMQKIQPLYKVSILSQASRIRARWWMLFDMVSALLAIRFAYSYAPKTLYYDVIPSQVLIFLFFVVIGGNISGLYEKDVFNKFKKLFFSTLVMVLLAIVCLSLFANIFIYKQIGRYVLLTIAGILLIISGGVRFLCYICNRFSQINVLFVGLQNTISDFTREIEQFNSRYKLIGFCHDELSSKTENLGETQEIAKICRDHCIDIVVVGDDYVRNPQILDKYFIISQFNCNFMDEETFVEYAYEQVLVNKVDPCWFYKARLGIHNGFQIFLKKVLDMIIALVGLFFLVLLFPFVWALIRFTSPGRAIYSQQRCGQFGKPFKIYKFRTMKSGAEINGAQWTLKKDDRITFIGGILRSTRLDELPQFWNVLKGEMSLVGPRPERPELVSRIEHETPFFHYRQMVKPGITGLAQIRCPYGISMKAAKEKLGYDLYYIKNWSILLDLQVILRTIAVIIKGIR